MFRNNAIGHLLSLFVATAVLVLCCLFTPSSSFAGPFRVSLLLGDTHTGTALEAIKAIREKVAGKSLPKGYDGVSLVAYPTHDIRQRDLRHLRESQLVIIRGGDRRSQDRRLVEAVQPALESAIRAGGRVYNVGGDYTVADRAMGIFTDEAIDAYYKTRVPENLKNMVLYALRKDFGFGVPVEEPVGLPESGIYESREKKEYTNFDVYQKALERRDNRPGKGGRPWVGVLFYRTSIESAQTEPVDAVIRSLEASGFNVLAAYAYPTEAAIRNIFLAPGVPKIRLLVALGAKMSQNAEAVIPLLNRLGVPVINAVALSGLSEDQWRKSPVGMDILERGWQISGPEMIGVIQPTVVASKERIIDQDTGLEYSQYRSIPGRIERLTQRVKSWINLQDKPNGDKKVAIVYYNYPPGKQNIGAAYLNVLPESLYEMARRMASEGYRVDGPGFGQETPEWIKNRMFADIHGAARNIGNWAPAELDRLVRTGRPILIPLETYKKWFSALPADFRAFVLKRWGLVETSRVMIWKDDGGRKFLVLPSVRYGNVLFAPQPSRGWEQDENKLYHDVLLPPHHQYVAFYLWLKNAFKADAVVHVGTHGTHEWLPGREVGFTESDPPEALITDMPNIYPYNVDNVAEGIQAKRRGMAVIIDHMTPPFDQAGLNREMKELASLLNDYRIARGKSMSLAATKLSEINALTAKVGLLKDMGKAGIADGDIEAVDDYLTELAEKQTPFGLHTFGKSPEDRYRKSTAEAIVAVEDSLTAAQRATLIAELERRIADSGPQELASFMAALAEGTSPREGEKTPSAIPTRCRRAKTSTPSIRRGYRANRRTKRASAWRKNSSRVTGNGTGRTRTRSPSTSGRKRRCATKASWSPRSCTCWASDRAGTNGEPLWAWRPSQGRNSGGRAST